MCTYEINMGKKCTLWPSASVTVLWSTIVTIHSPEWYGCSWPEPPQATGLDAQSGHSSWTNSSLYGKERRVAMQNCSSKGIRPKLKVLQSSL